MQILDVLPAFVAVVEAGSISRAARQLGVPRATLSRRITGLEDALGVRLLHRSTRRQVLTPAGETLYERALVVVQDAEDAVQAVQRLDGVPRGLLRLAAPPALGDGMARVLSTFLARFPEVQLEVEASTRHVDLVAEQVDVALRAGQVTAPELIGRKVWSTEVLAVASPDYLAARGTPTSAASLADHDCILGFVGGTTPERAWPLRGGGTVPVHGRLTTNDLLLRVEAARSGQGIAMLPHLVVAEALDAGMLVPVLADEVGTHSALTLVYAERKHLDPKVRAFVDHVMGSLDLILRPTLPRV